MAVIAIDLGGTKALGAVFDGAGNKVREELRYLNGAGADAAADLTAELVSSLKNSYAS